MAGRDPQPMPGRPSRAPLARLVGQAGGDGQASGSTSAASRNSTSPWHPSGAHQHQRSMPRKSGSRARQTGLADAYALPRASSSARHGGKSLAPPGLRAALAGFNHCLAWQTSPIWAPARRRRRAARRRMFCIPNVAPARRSVVHARDCCPPGGVCLSLVSGSNSAKPCRTTVAARHGADPAACGSAADPGRAVVAGGAAHTTSTCLAHVGRALGGGQQRNHRATRGRGSLRRGFCTQDEPVGGEPIAAEATRTRARGAAIWGAVLSPYSAPGGGGIGCVSAVRQCGRGASVPGDVPQCEQKPMKNSGLRGRRGAKTAADGTDALTHTEPFPF